MNTYPLSFSFKGRLSGKARPRFLKGENKIYTQRKTQNQERMIQQYFIASFGKPLLVSPLSVKIELTLEPPKSWTKYKRSHALNGKILPTIKPDLDNVAKLILDALNGFAYQDDRQVTRLEINRSYGISDKVQVEISPIGGEV
ncbi:RusA family crossover junction endodeoxyribonuclease [Acetobacteraceae bacterium]|nr:RusA family crossover junction endodeoxyribonuclease [Acetobacteraceae bacterium]